MDLGSGQRLSTNVNKDVLGPGCAMTYDFFATHVLRAVLLEHLVFKQIAAITMAQALKKFGIKELA